MLGPIFARAIMSLLQGRAAARFDRQTQQPDATQWQTLSRILSRNANTEVGRLYGFAEMKCPADFQARVPLVTAEEIAPLIARMAAGEQGVLTAQTPNFFCQTGGTTGQPKLSPVTPDYTKEFQGTIHTWLYHVRRQFPDILGGKAMYLVGTAEAGRTEGDIPYGTMTGYNFKALPGFMQKLYALPYEYALIQDYEAKYYTALRIALPQDVRFLISVTPNNLLLLGRKLAQYDERLLDDLEAGTLWDELPITAEVRQALAPGLGPQPEVARRLRELRQRRGSALRPVDVWPNLRLLACWKSGPSAPYPAAKMAGEGYCRAYCRSYGLPTKIVRFFNVYGPGIRRLVVHDLILKLLHDPSRLEIFGDGNQVRDFLHVDDAVAGMHLVAEKGAPGELYHVGSGQPVSIRQLIAVIANQLNLTDLKIVSVGNSWKGDMPQWYADPSKLQELGFNTSVDLPTGVAETIEWIRQNELDGCQ